MEKENEQFQWDVCELRSPKMNLLEMSCTLRLGKISTDNIIFYFLYYVREWKCATNPCVSSYCFYIRIMCSKKLEKIFVCDFCLLFVVIVNFCKIHFFTYFKKKTWLNHLKNAFCFILETKHNRNKS